MVDQFIGRRINLGIAKEGVRGAGAVPTYWLPRTNLTFDEKAEKVISEESLGVIDDSHEAFVVSRWGEGDVEGEIKDKSMGVFLYGLLGTCSSAVKETTAYNHIFTEAQTNLHQSLSFTADDPIGDKIFKLVMMNNLTLSAALGKVIDFKSNFMSLPAVDSAGQIASYTVENKFVCNHLVFKLAANLAGLTAASEIRIKNLTITFNKNLLRSHVLGTIQPDDIFNQQFAVEGSFELDYQDRTYLDYMLSNNYKAMRIDLINDGTTIGATSNPQLQINMPRVHFFNWEGKKTLNEISTQTVNFKALRNVAGPNDLVSSIVLTNEAISY